MSVALGTRPWIPDDAALVSALGDGGIAVLGIDRRSFPYRSTAHLEQVRASVADGDPMHLVLKAHAPRQGGQRDSPARPEFVSDPLREAAVYRTLLPSLDASTPRLFACGFDPDGAWSWLLLERVPGRPLWQEGEHECWHAAARWLSGIHGRLAGEVDHWTGPARPLVMTRGLHRRWLDRARALTPEDDDRRRRVLSELAVTHSAVLDALDALPVTVLHGEFFPSNVLVREDRRCDSICPVDWESAAIGPCLLDMAALTSGRWELASRRLIEDAYHTQAREHGLFAEDVDTFRRGLAAARVQLAVTQLGWSADWSPPPEHRHDWVEDIADWLQDGAR